LSAPEEQGLDFRLAAVELAAAFLATNPKGRVRALPRRLEAGRSLAPDEGHEPASAAGLR